MMPMHDGLRREVADLVSAADALRTAIHTAGEALAPDAIALIHPKVAEALSAARTAGEMLRRAVAGEPNSEARKAADGFSEFTRLRGAAFRTFPGSDRQ